MTDLRQKIKAVEGDITRLNVDAIVNAANRSLMGGGGVDGAIHRAAGPELKAATKKIRQERYPDGLPVGEAVITPGFRLPARYVIHTVGPVWRGGTRGEPRLLFNAYFNSLRQAHRQGDIRTIAFPAISAGVYGYPYEASIRKALEAFSQYFRTHPEAPLETVLLVGYGQPAYHKIISVIDDFFASHR